MNMFEKLDIDKVKLTPEMIVTTAAVQSANDKTKEKPSTNQEMLNSL